MAFTFFNFLHMIILTTRTLLAKVSRCPGCRGLDRTAQRSLTAPAPATVRLAPFPRSSTRDPGEYLPLSLYR